MSGTMCSKTLLIYAIVDVKKSRRKIKGKHFESMLVITAREFWYQPNAMTVSLWKKTKLVGENQCSLGGLEDTIFNQK